MHNSIAEIDNTFVNVKYWLLKYNQQINFNKTKVMYFKLEQSYRA